MTEHNKAITALIMAAITVANSYGAHIGVSSDVVSNVLTLLTPVLVWLIPNKKGTP